MIKLPWHFLVKGAYFLQKPFYFTLHKIHAAHYYIALYTSVVSALTLHEHYTTLHGII